ncbi:hypothetical protein CL6EHI_013930 [Entamoeba histolytica]|uniref:Uncharacterized protein n=3 Tax=Entamoeba histolytica TaxID=5759 RepID=C4LXN5_ENTH1|nr:hypothetical protein EHI_013930 [Entamoeba histolytica HM-1:IMSS]EAL45104.1 hypothetical protein EHI_013930 [Entamoeba histolytica HM-1:IMSS]GAT93524.1 hypothetical protein CL6EHI_013930 [Entamoeba histolytica]|eukprot:XP_650490.1 hypothetical protein EHI_013930 [Entamoeba histolytica HM-1:IMSS]
MQTSTDGYYNIEMIDMMNCQYLSFVKEEKPIKHNASEKEEITREMKKRNYHQIRTRKGDKHKIGKKSEEHNKEEKENTGRSVDETIEEDEGKKKTRINEKKKEKNKRTNKENMIKGMSEEEKMKEEKEIQYSNTPINQEIKIYNIIKEGYQRIKKGEIIEGKEYQEETKKSGGSVGSDLTIISMIKKYGISDKKEIHNNPIIKYQLEENNGIRNEEYCQKVISERIKYLVELITININDKSFHTIPH